MIRIATLAVAALALAAGVAPAQYVIVNSPPPGVVTYAPAPVYLPAAPVVVHSSPVVTYSAPAPVSYSYYPPQASYSYYAPQAVNYSYYPPATTVYSAPSVVVPGYTTTRSYVGWGIFRPRGVYTESYFVPR